MTTTVAAEHAEEYALQMSTPDVLTALLQSKIPSIAWPMVLTTCAGEGGTGSSAWWTAYGGAVLNIPLTSVFNAADPLWNGLEGPNGISHALGAGQFEPATYGSTAARTGLADLEPQSQLANIWDLMQHDYTAHTERILLDDLNAATVNGTPTWQYATSVLVPTWASYDSPKLSKRYANAVKDIAMATVPVPPPSPSAPPPSSPTDPEIQAIEDVLRDLTPLDPAARKRVIDYVLSRLSVSP